MIQSIQMQILKLLSVKVINKTHLFHQIISKQALLYYIYTILSTYIFQITVGIDSIHHQT